VVAAPEEHLKLQAPATPYAIGELRGKVDAYAVRLGASEAVREAIRLAVSEALTNVVLHAYDGHVGTMTLEASCEDAHRLVIVVLDEGCGFIPRPMKRMGEGLGLGLGLMAQMADDFRVGPRNGSPGTSVSLRFALR
jgi:serine/threonine-protein kinase RsbW